MSEFLTVLRKDRKFYGTTIHTASTAVEQSFPREVSTAMEPVWIGLNKQQTLFTNIESYKHMLQKPILIITVLSLVAKSPYLYFPSGVCDST
jgi:hypothetical protein